MNHLASGPGKVTYIQTRLEISRQWKCDYFDIKTNEQLQREVDITLKNIDNGVRKIKDNSSATRGTVDKLAAITKQFQLRLKKHNRLEREKKILHEEHQKLQDKYIHLKNKRKAAELKMERRKSILHHQRRR